MDNIDEVDDDARFAQLMGTASLDESWHPAVDVSDKNAPFSRRDIDAAEHDKEEEPA